jgi:putative phosphoesterase
MRLGILSDTHDRVEAMAAGMDALRKNGAEFFIHCGDIGGQRVLDLLAGTSSLFVWGNTDFDRQSLTRYAQALGIDCRGDLAELQLAGKSIAVTHGHDHQIMRQILRGDSHDYLLHGHTHIARDERTGRLRVINPGALHRATQKSVALLDLHTDVLQYLQINI